MRTTERQSRAFQALLKEAEKSPITISFRGVDDRDRGLYEVKSRTGEIISAQDTEVDLCSRLMGTRPKDERVELVRAEE